MGVFRNEKEGMVPVRAGILSGGQGSYEIEQDISREGIKQHWVNLHFPRAFEEPKTFTVDALWLQPWLPVILRQKIRIDPYNISIIGLNWNLIGDIIPHAENAFQEEIEGFMHLLTLKNKSMLNIDDVTSILRILGSVHQGKFKGVVDLLTDIRVEEASLQKSTAPSMLKLVYFLKFKEISPAILPLVETFSIHVGRIIDAWISEAKIEVKVEVS
jgi:type VI secretion system protein ImpG